MKHPSPEKYCSLSLAISSGLSVEQAFKLRQKPDSFVSINDFVSGLRNSERYGLGIHTEHYKWAIRNFQIKPYRLAFKELDYPPSDTFMDVFVERDMSAYFFVPPNVLTHESARFTKAEIEWCMENPDKLANIQFVFGLYDLPIDKLKRLTQRKSDFSLSRVLYLG